jgi:hypothetical protein
MEPRVKDLENPFDRRLVGLVNAALPGAQLLRTEWLGADSPETGETHKGAGYGVPVRIDVRQDGVERSLVLHTASSNAYGHDRRADRAAAAILSADTFLGLPRHVQVLDVGAYRGLDDFVSLAGTGEFYLLTDYAAGRPYADDLRRIAESQELTPTDLERSRGLVNYLLELHREQPRAAKTSYERFVRDTLGSGEGIFGISDGYPDDVPAASRERLDRIERSCLEWRLRLRKRSERLRRTHGDFHPFNLLFDEQSNLFVLDASRGAVGDPGDDLSCMSINFAFFSLGRPGAWRNALGKLWHGFWESYLSQSGDQGVLDVVAPLFAWRGLVLASPKWYPDLSAEDRNRMLSFVEHVLSAPRFSPNMADAFFDT